MHKTLLTLLAAATMATSAHAAGLAMDFTTPTTDFTNNTWSLGWEFNVLNPVTVTQLGFYDDFKNDLTESHDVGIYNSAGTLLVSGTVAPGAALMSWFRMVSVAPTVLGAGTGYRIAATTGSENYTWDPIGFTTHPDVVFVNDRYDVSTTLIFPTSGPAGVTGWFGPTFALDSSAVPEPSTWLMLAAGLVAAGAYRRKG